jgi:hypothetical protein
MDMEENYKRVSDDNIITVTHTINPNKFYIRYSSFLQKDNVERLETELKMEKYYSSQRLPERRFMPRQNEMVAFYHPNWQHHIRVIIDVAGTLNNEPSFVLWAIDYGIPLHTRNPGYLLPLPDEFKTYSEVVFEGSLDVLPGRKTVNFRSNTTDLVKGHEWTDLSVQLFQKCLADAAEMKFIPVKVLPIESDYQMGKIYFGDVLLKTNSGSVFSLRKIMLQEQFAVEVQDLAKEYLKSSTSHIERWNDNFRHGGIQKTTISTVLDKYVQKPPKVEATSLDKIQNWNTKAPTSGTARDAISVNNNLEVLSSTFNSTVTLNGTAAAPPKATNRLAIYKKIVENRKQKEQMELSFNQSDFETSTRKETGPGSSNNQILQLQERLAHRLAVKKETKQEEPIVRSVLVPAGASYDDQIVKPIHHIRPGEKSILSSGNSDSSSVKSDGARALKPKPHKMLFNRSKARLDERSQSSSSGPKEEDTIQW